MSFTITAFNHEEWQRYDLAEYGDFADMISECNVGEDAFSGYGDWFYVPDEPLPDNDRVVYFGSWGNDNSPGASRYTYAEIFNMDDPEDAEAYRQRGREWENQPEYDENQVEFED